MTEDDQQPFSEEAALRELEDLQRAIEASRVRRKDANDAFDRFVGSFDRRPAPASTPAPPPAPRPLPLPPVAAAPVLPPAPAALPAPPDPAPARPVGPPATTTPEIVAAPPVSAQPGQADRATLLSSPEDPAESPDIIDLTPARLTPANVDVHPRDFPSERSSRVPDAFDLDNWDQGSATGVGAFPEESDRGPLPSAGAAFPGEPRTVPSALAMPGLSGRRIPPAALVAAVLVIAAVAFFALRGKSDDASQTDPVAAETPAAAPQPAPQPAPPVATPPPPRAEISTLRQVWIRVTVDGQKVVERELPPNTRIPLDPVSQFVVRAGDAGAVRVAIAGKDQGPVGADGRVATKAFTVPPKAGQ